METTLAKLSAECRLWFNANADSEKPHVSVRSTALRPCEDVTELCRVLASTATADANVSSKKLSVAVEQVVTARRLAMRTLSLHSENCSLGEIKGRYLIYNPQSTFLCGLAQEESSGLFDESDCPGWDTWIRWGNDRNMDFIVCWIPQCLIAIAQQGIIASTGFALSWLDSGSFPETDFMKSILAELSK